MTVAGCMLFNEPGLPLGASPANFGYALPRATTDAALLAIYGCRTAMIALSPFEARLWASAATSSKP